MKSDFLTGPFEEAVKDYLWLSDRNYPEQPALKLVGDRYGLSGDQRNILYRGITAQSIARRRKSKLTDRLGVTGKILIVDGYNVLFTLTSYLLGRPVFISNDGFLRDAGGGYGKMANQKKFQMAIKTLTGYLAEHAQDLKIRNLIIVLDEPVKESNRHMRLILDEMQGGKLKPDVKLAPSADEELIRWPQREKDVVLATSDSGIIDAAACGIHDLARHLLESKFGKPGKQGDIFSFCTA